MTEPVTHVPVRDQPGWHRTVERHEMVERYLARIRRQYRHADPRLRKLLLDCTIWGTTEIAQECGLPPARVQHWYAETRLLADADQVPHPKAFIAVDASSGLRGATEVRGFIAGRVREHLLAAGKRHWSPIAGEIVAQPFLNHGGKPKTGA